MSSNNIRVKIMKDREAWSNNQKQGGFTLAEVLITLGVIGVVAAVTMPTVIKNLNNAITVSKLKKSYAEISQMANNIKVNTGCETLECTGLLTDFSLEKFVEYSGLKNAKIYYTNFNWTQPLYCEKEECEDRTGLVFRNIIITDGNTGYFVNVNNRPDPYLPETSFIVIGVITNNPKRAVKGIQIFKQGRDTFRYVITENLTAEPVVMGFGAKMWSLSETQKYKNDYISVDYIKRGCDSNSTEITHLQGFSCAARILLDGWKINY